MYMYMYMYMYVYVYVYMYMYIAWTVMGIHPRGVQSEGGAVDGGSII